MPRTSPSTPAWVKALLIAVVAGAALWFVVDRRDRLGNEARLGAIASRIAGREVRVNCPGPVGRLLGYDIVEGSVRFDAEGRPADEADLSLNSCAELDALAEGRAGKDLACIERTRIPCGPRGGRIAMAVDVLTHEAFHMSGIQDEGLTECRSLQAMAWAAQELGTTAEQGRALATAHYGWGYRDLPERYQHAGCAEGGELDERPGDPRFP